MRGDSTQRVTAGGDDSRVRRGPRHAAPRKSLLTKLQIPAGKAMALAAMPTAVFVGMGLTPRLALADDSKDIPFAPGPCVTRSDEPSASASESPTSTPSASESASPEPGESPSTTPEPAASGSAAPGEEDSGSSGSGSSGAGSSGPGASDSREPADTSSGPTATPTPTKSKNPLDPLGLGDALGDLLGVPDKGATSSPEPSTSATGKPDAEPSTKPTSEPGSSEPDSAADGSPDGEGTGDGPADTAVEGIKDGVDGTKDAIKEAADKVGAEVEELDADAKGLDARKDDDIPEGADGKEPFPCPTADPEALAAAKEEQGIPLLPDDPWTLHSSLLTLRGLDYKGIVEVRTGSGKLKKALKFTSTSVDIQDLHQTLVYPEGRTAHVKAREGSTSTIRDGEVTMYTERLKGNLFGLIPITFSPETPPPLNIPFAFFTDVEVTQAGQFGGTLTVPGLQNYLTH
ncbi:hypothetical protein ACIRQP_38630 [Streptomyces sp. NPDC102274]|uniref:hypothetical protein n=1 Tax=Streptomyces sp. NPDC102274 TaxID=3366151 RepID=UPI0037FF761E